MRKKITPIKKLQKRAEQLWKLVAFLRDGRECQVKLTYPDIDIRHSSVMQVDHTFSRRDKNLFFDPANSLVVCSTCNMLKKFQQQSVHRLVDNIVKDREGETKFYDMQRINLAGNPNHLFKQRLWLEEVIKDLESLADYYQNKAYKEAKDAGDIVELSQLKDYAECGT